MNRIFDVKLKIIHMIIFELLPFFKILETSCMDFSWKNSRLVIFFELSPFVKLRPFEKN